MALSFGLSFYILSVFIGLSRRGIMTGIYIILSPTLLVFQVQESRQSFISSSLPLRLSSKPRDQDVLPYYPLTDSVDLPNRGIKGVSYIILSLSSPWLYGSFKPRDWDSLPYYSFLDSVSLPSQGIEMVFHIIFSSTLLVFRAKRLKWSPILYSPMLCWLSEPRGIRFGLFTFSRGS